MNQVSQIALLGIVIATATGCILDKDSLPQGNWTSGCIQDETDPAKSRRVSLRTTEVDLIYMFESHEDSVCTSLASVKTQFWGYTLEEDNLIELTNNSVLLELKSQRVVDEANANSWYGQTSWSVDGGWDIAGQARTSSELRELKSGEQVKGRYKIDSQGLAMSWAVSADDPRPMSAGAQVRDLIYLEEFVDPAKLDGQWSSGCLQGNDPATSSRMTLEIEDSSLIVREEYHNNSVCTHAAYIKVSYMGYTDQNEGNNIKVVNNGTMLHLPSQSLVDEANTAKWYGLDWTTDTAQDIDGLAKSLSDVPELELHEEVEGRLEVSSDGLNISWALSSELARPVSAEGQVKALKFIRAL